MRKNKLTLIACAFSVVIVAACASSQAMTSDSSGTFEYKEIYLPERWTDDYKSLGLNNLDTDWGLWGHNLMDILPENPSKTIYAKQNGGNHKEQLCFSSNKLFQYITDYINSNFSETTPTRFAIMPNDNGIVCQCDECVALGNTPGDASAAIHSLIEKLAVRFPAHTFFTSSYRSAKSAPANPLPANTGVLISAIDFPLAGVTGEADDNFKSEIGKWKDKTGHIYIWDYVNNFDDYFTPYPVFTAMQNRLRLYRDSGVDGIFFNGSGSDFSSFSKLKTLVLTAMLNNPDLDWKEYLKQKSRELYPVAGDHIAGFMKAQEDYVTSQGQPLPLYKGVETALETYLPVDEFVSFHELINTLIPQTSGEEREELTKLSRAFELTRLEIMRLQGDPTLYRSHLDNLRKINTENGIQIYSETCWPVNTYVKDYESMVNHWSPASDNKLKGLKVTSMSKLDPADQNERLLTDGLLGLPANYHDGMLINSPEELWRFSIPQVPGMKTIRVWLVVNPAFKIGLPKKITLSANDRLLTQVVPQKPLTATGHTFVDIEIPNYSSGPFVVTLVRDPDVRIMAVDEIEGF